ncbi:DNA polymerase Y family protein [Nitratifractor sp.]
MFFHIDIDSFFVSAERSRDPSLRGIPAAVGGRSNLEIFDPAPRGVRLMDENRGAFVAPVFHSGPKGRFEEYFVDRDGGRERIRGIVTTVSYEARALGVKTGMPIAQALRLCPELIVVPGDLLFYHRLSAELFAFLRERIPAIEQFSIDEFFGDGSGWVESGECEAFARRLQGEIFERFALPVSIGIAPSKWIAKLATGFAKPYGVYRVEEVEPFIREIPIEEFPGIGRGYARRLKERGICTLGELTRHRRLLERWGKPGITLYRRVLGIDGEGIAPGASRQSIGISRTFDPIGDVEELRRRVVILARHAGYIAMKLGFNPTRYHLRIRYRYGERAKGSRRVDRIFGEGVLKREIRELFEEIHLPGGEAVKIALSLSDFTRNHPRTLSLLEWERDLRERRLSRGIQRIRERFGLDAIRTADELLKPPESGAGRRKVPER